MHLWHEQLHLYPYESIQLTPCSRALLQKLTAFQLVNKLSALNCSHRYLLPCSQEPAIGPCLEPDESIPNLLHYCIRIRFNIIPPPYRSPKWSLPSSSSRLKFCSHISSHHACCMSCPTKSIIYKLTTV